MINTLHLAEDLVVSVSKGDSYEGLDPGYYMSDLHQLN